MLYQIFNPNLNENLIVNFTKEEGYGMLHTSFLLNNYLNVNLIYVIILIIFITLTLNKKTNRLVVDFVNLKDNQYLYSLVFWFIFCSIYLNNSYRMINFIFFIFHFI